MATQRQSSMSRRRCSGITPAKSPSVSLPPQRHQNVGTGVRSTIGRDIDGHDQKPISFQKILPHTPNATSRNFNAISAVAWAAMGSRDPFGHSVVALVAGATVLR
jgi:hypothetical protein